MAVISVLDDLLSFFIQAMRDADALRPDDEPLETTRHLFANVFEQGDYANRDIDAGEAMAMIHARDESVAEDASQRSTSKYIIDIPIDVEVTFRRPSATDSVEIIRIMTPGQYHRYILARMQEDIGIANSSVDGSPSQVPDGVQFVFYEGTGSLVAPIDANDPAERFGFVSSWRARYHMNRKDARKSTA